MIQISFIFGLNNEMPYIAMLTFRLTIGAKLTCNGGYHGPLCRKISCESKNFEAGVCYINCGSQNDDENGHFDCIADITGPYGRRLCHAGE